MSDKDILNRANFGLLEEPEGRWRSFGVSMGINGTIVVLLLLFAAAKIHQAQVKRDMTQLIVPVDLPKPIKPLVPKVKITAPPVQLMAKLDPPKIETPKLAEPEPPKPVKLDIPKPIPVIPPAPPKAVAPPPAPKVGLFQSAKPTEVANNQNKPTPKTGGFGDPVGAKVNPNSMHSAIAAAGSFAMATGANSGAGAARKGVVQGVGFGSGVVNGVAGGTSHGTVASAGFSNGVIGGTPGGTGHGTVGRAGFYATGGDFRTEGTVHQGSTAAARRRRSNSPGKVPGERAGGSTARRKRSGSWTGRTGEACCGEHPLQACTEERSASRPHNPDPHHIPVGLVGNCNSNCCNRH
jgi:hypothetical protein